MGRLRPGEQAELVGSVPYWHQVKLADGTPGFVSKRWTRVIPTGPPLFRVPDARRTYPFGISPNGWIVGFYQDNFQDADGRYRRHGFLVHRSSLE